MRILWIVNMVLPKLADRIGIPHGMSGTWMYDASERLAKLPDVELAIACVYGDSFKKHEVDGTTFYCLPGGGKDMLFYNKSYEKLWEQIYEDFRPDVVNIHGTEYTHALSFVRRYPNVKTVVSLQGVINRIKDVDLIELNKAQALGYRTLREWMHFNGMLELHMIHKKNAKSEAEILRSVDYIMCVDSWHHSMALWLNPKAKRFTVNYNLRESFYTAPNWDPNTAEKYTITTNPGGTPLKGLHNLVKAVAIVKQYYPEVKVKVPGMKQKNGELEITSGYSIYLRRLIRKLGLEKNIEFLGSQTEEQMMNNMLSARVQVIPSAIEGPSLVLREGMHLKIAMII